MRPRDRKKQLIEQMNKKVLGEGIIDLVKSWLGMSDGMTIMSGPERDLRWINGEAQPTQWTQVELMYFLLTDEFSKSDAERLIKSWDSNPDWSTGGIGVLVPTNIGEYSRESASEYKSVINKLQQGSLHKQIISTARDNGLSYRINYLTSIKGQPNSEFHGNLFILSDDDVKNGGYEDLKDYKLNKNKPKQNVDPSTITKNTPLDDYLKNPTSSKNGDNSTQR
jgi:hypothetical protein